MNRFHMQTNYAVFGLLVISGLMCPVLAAELKPLSIDKAEISAIEFSLVDGNLDQFGFGFSTKLITERVSKNLTEWQYPVKLNETRYSHTLEAILGKIVNEETPTGFSYSTGNSDPRSPQFQKANVLPISCRLKKTGSKDTNTDHKMTFSAYQLSGGFSQTKVVDKLVDQISTACLGLLEELKLPTAGNTTDSTTFKPTWMPEFRVEVKQVTEPADPKNTKPSVTESNDNGRKQIIIYNQGSPLTIDFGHVRR